MMARTGKILMVVATFMMMEVMAGTGSSLSVLPSIEWQKINLQEKVQRKVEKSISTVLKPNQFIVEVDISVNAPKKPNFAKAGKAAGKNKIRLSNVDPKKIPKDSLVFAKFGLEAPLVEDFADLKNKSSELEELWDFNESIDIFKNLDAVEVFVSLSDKLTEETKASVQQITDSLKFTLGEVEPDFSIEYMKLEEDIVQEFTFAKFVDMVAKFGNMIGLILAALLMGVVGYILMKKYFALQQKGASSTSIDITSKMEAPEQDEDDKTIEGLGGGAGGPSMIGDDASSYDGIKRFKLFLQNSPNEAVLLVKKWIRSDEKAATYALQAIVQQLDNDELTRVFGFLTPQDRNEWKSKLKKALSTEDLQTAKLYISNQVVEDIIVPPVILDASICDLLLALTPEKGAQLIKEKPDLGRILLNVMNTRFISNTLTHLEDIDASAAISSSMDFKPEEVEDKMDEFKETLESYQEKKEKFPFVDRVVDLIPVVARAHETHLYKALGRAGEDDLIKKLAEDYFPSDLIPTLPEDLMKVILVKYPLNPKVELIASVEEKVQEKFISIFAPPGSVAKDMLDLEMEKVTTDLVFAKRIKNEKDDIWRDFVKFARKMIKSEKSYAEEVDNLLTNWIGEITGNSSVVEDINKAA